MKKKEIKTTDEIHSLYIDAEKRYNDNESYCDSHDVAEVWEKKWVSIESLKQWIARERLYEKEQRGKVRNAEGFFNCIDKIERDFLIKEE